MVQSIATTIAGLLMIAPLNLPDVQAQVAERIQAAKTKGTPSDAKHLELAPPAPNPPPPAPKPVQATTTPRRVNSTAYCLTGTMANGQRAHYGAVAYEWGFLRYAGSDSLWSSRRHNRSREGSHRTFQRIRPCLSGELFGSPPIRAQKYLDFGVLIG